MCARDGIDSWTDGCSGGGGGGGGGDGGGEGVGEGGGDGGGGSGDGGGGGGGGGGSGSSSVCSYGGGSGSSSGCSYGGGSAWGGGGWTGRLGRRRRQLPQCAGIAFSLASAGRGHSLKSSGSRRARFCASLLRIRVARSPCSGS